MFEVRKPKPPQGGYHGRLSPVCRLWVLHLDGQSRLLPNQPGQERLTGRHRLQSHRPMDLTEDKVRQQRDYTDDTVVSTPSGGIQRILAP